MSGSIKSKENFWLLSFWRLMSRVNNVEENIISGEIKPRRIKSKGNFCPGGLFLWTNVCDSASGGLALLPWIICMT